MGRSPADEEGERQRDDDEEREEDQRQCGVVEAPLQCALVVLAHLLELVVELLMPAPDPVGLHLGLGIGGVLIEADLAAQQEVHHGGHDGAREEVARHHGEGDGLGQRRKEVLRRAGQQHHRG